LMLVLMPRGDVETAEAAAGPTVWQFSPSTVASLDFSGAYIEITGTNWPKEMYGLSAHLVNDDEWVQLETISYVPDAGRMVVMVPPYNQASDGTTYDLVVMKISGARTVLQDVFTVTDDSASGSEGNGNEEETTNGEDTTSADRPTPEVFKANANGPDVIDYYPSELLGNPYSGTTLTILGHNWPDEMYGLVVQLVDPMTNNIFNCLTISYAPIAGRIVVQTPVISLTNDALLDIYISDNQGGRTVIKDGLWFRPNVN